MIFHSFKNNANFATHFFFSTHYLRLTAFKLAIDPYLSSAFTTIFLPMRWNTDQYHGLLN